VRNGTLPEVWIPPAELRGLMRTRLATRSHTTVLKSRIHAAQRRYGVMAGESSVNLFSQKRKSRWTWSQTSEEPPVQPGSAA
jgi:hypothetical protein